MRKKDKISVKQVKPTALPRDSVKTQKILSGEAVFLREGSGPGR